MKFKLISYTLNRQSGDKLTLHDVYADFEAGLVLDKLARDDRMQVKNVQTFDSLNHAWKVQKTLRDGE